MPDPITGALIVGAGITLGWFGLSAVKALVARWRHR